MQVELLGLIAEGRGHIQTVETTESEWFPHHDKIQGKVHVAEEDHAPELVGEVVENHSSAAQPILTVTVGDTKYTFHEYAINMPRQDDGGMTVSFEASVVSTDIQSVDESEASYE